MLEPVAAELCHVRLDPHTMVPCIDNVQQPDTGITQAPSVWRMLEETNDPASVEWLLEKCLYNELGSLKLLKTGVVVPLEHEEQYSASIRLEMLIKITQQRRSRYYDNPNDILSIDKVTDLLNELKDDYPSWMTESAQRGWFDAPHRERHAYTRSRWRNFLWKMCGHYYLVVFWLYVPASWRSLRIFMQIFVDGNEETSNEIKLQNAVRAARSALRNAHT